MFSMNTLATLGSPTPRPRPTPWYAPSHCPPLPRQAHRHQDAASRIWASPVVPSPSLYVTMVQKSGQCQMKCCIRMSEEARCPGLGGIGTPRRGRLEARKQIHWGGRETGVTMEELQISRLEKGTKFHLSGTPVLCRLGKNRGLRVKVQNCRTTLILLHLVCCMTIIFSGENLRRTSLSLIPSRSTQAAAPQNLPYW